jgi:hypothetical protein
VEKFMGNHIRVMVLALLGTAFLATGAALAAEQEVSISGGKAPLYGTLLMPDTDRAVPAVLLLAGSGPTDRDGNSSVPGVKPATLKLIAEGLAEHGIASLRVDKLGIGKSAAAMTAEADLRFDNYVDDAIAWANFLRAQPRVRCLFILGHSEGAQIGALAAAKVPVCGLISVAGTGQLAGDVILRQMQSAPPALFAQIQWIVAQLKQGKTVADVPPQLMILFRPSVQPYLISWFAKDPVAAIAAVKAPVLVMQGTTDIQVRVEDARLLASARPGITLVLLDGTNHVLKTAPADPAANIATYADPTLALAPGVMPAVTAFIDKNASP